MKIEIINNSKNELPQYSTSQSAGLDLRANLEESVTLKPFERSLIPTGLHIALPDGYEAQVRPRSGLAYKKGVTVLNAPGTIDADYRGDIGVILINMSNEDFVVENGERIAQLVIAKYDQAEWIQVTELSETNRGEGGFGSTIAHGYLTVSLLPYLWEQIAEINNIKMMINYGIEKLKFNQPVRVDHEVRLRVKLSALADLRGITKCQLNVKLEIKDNPKPAFTGEFIFLYHFKS